MRWLTLSLLLFSLPSTGQVVQNFSLINVVDGNTISLDDYSSSQGVVIIFTSNNCPYDGYYLNRIKELAELFKNKIPVLLINANTEESDDQMKRYAENRKISVPYLSDKEQKVLVNLNARKNPECFLLHNLKGKFTVVYRGAIDDNPQTASSVNHYYLKEAINKLLASQKIETPDVRPVGCNIRKN